MMRLIKALDVLLSLGLLDHEAVQRKKRQQLKYRLHRVFSTDAIAASLDCEVRPMLKAGRE